MAPLVLYVSGLPPLHKPFDSQIPAWISKPVARSLDGLFEPGKMHDKVYISQSQFHHTGAYLYFPTEHKEILEKKGVLDWENVTTSPI